MRNVWPSRGGRRRSPARAASRCARPRAKSAAVVAVVHEQHVDVGRVRQLGAAESAHADHRERKRRLERARARASSARLGEARSARARSSSSVGEAEQVAGRDPEQLASLEAAEPVAALLARRPASRACRARRSTSSPRGRSRPRASSSSARVSTNSGWRRSASPTTPARAEDAARALGRARRVAERRCQRCRRAPVPSASGGAASSPRSGSGVVRQPLEDHGQQLLHDARTAGEPARRAPRTAARVRSTSVKPNAARRSSAASGESGAGAGERLEDRCEEQLLVDGAHRASGARGARRRSCSSAVCPGRSRYPSTRARRVRASLVGGKRVGLLLVVELEPVLDRAEERGTRRSRRSASRSST